MTATVPDLFAALGPATDFAGAPCVGRWAWFDPPNDHEPAAAVQSPTKPPSTSAAPARCPPWPAALPPPAPCRKHIVAACGPGPPTTFPPRKAPADEHSTRPRTQCTRTAGTAHTLCRQRLPVPEQDHLLPATQPRGFGARHRPPPRDRACKSPSRGRSCHGARPGIHGRRARHSRAVTLPAPPPPGSSSPSPSPAAPPNRSTRSSTRDRKTK